MDGGRSSIPSEEGAEEDMDGGASDSLGGCAAAKALDRPGMKWLLLAELEMLAVSPFNMLISSCKPEIIYASTGIT